MRALGVVVVCLWGCGPGGEPGPGAFAADFRSSGAFFSFQAQRAPSTGNSPHGFVRMHYSVNARSQLERGSFPLPEGTVAIKEQARSLEGPLEALTVMVKGAQGWRYESYSPEGAALPTSAAFCGGCHGQFTATDSLGGTAVR
jgi:hypothetical protein